MQISVSVSKVSICGIAEFVVVDDECQTTVDEETLLNWIAKVASQLGLATHRGNGSQIILRGLAASFVYIRPEGNRLYVSDNMRNLVNLSGDVAISRTSILMMLEVGFVLPPLTIFEGIYRLWPFSELSRFNR